MKIRTRLKSNSKLQERKKKNYPHCHNISEYKRGINHNISGKMKIPLKCLHQITLDWTLN